MGTSLINAANIRENIICYNPSGRNTKHVLQLEQSEFVCCLGSCNKQRPFPHLALTGRVSCGHAMCCP
jgi:hypothetical protein